MPLRPPSYAQVPSLRADTLVLRRESGEARDLVKFDRGGD
ncbi:hypothetical protein RSAG8_10836, partial [Rhizoctonia solani AG-8 WAC10335]